MNFRERVEVENKKNNDSLSHPCNLVNRWCLTRKIPTKREKKRKKKEKNTGKAQTKLNAPHVRSCKNTISLYNYIINNWR